MRSVTGKKPGEVTPPAAAELLSYVVYDGQMEILADTAVTGCPSWNRTSLATSSSCRNPSMRRPRHAAQPPITTGAGSRTAGSDTIWGVLQQFEDHRRVVSREPQLRLRLLRSSTVVKADSVGLRVPMRTQCPDGKP